MIAYGRVMKREYPCSGPLLYIRPVTHVWGVFTAIVLWGVGVDVSIHRHQLGIYIIIAALVVTILETLFAVLIFLEIINKEEDKCICQGCCKVLQILDTWKRGLLYFAMSILFFIEPTKVWLAVIAGVMLIILAIFYVLIAYKEQNDSRGTLLADKDNSYDRFDDLQSEIDDSFPEPSDNVGTQSEILEV